MAILFIATEIEKRIDRDPEYHVIGAYSSKELAQQALLTTLRNLQESDPEACPFEQGQCDQGLCMTDVQGNQYILNLVTRVLDEIG